MGSGISWLRSGVQRQTSPAGVLPQVGLGFLWEEMEGRAPRKQEEAMLFWSTAPTDASTGSVVCPEPSRPEAPVQWILPCPGGQAARGQCCVP